MKNKKTIFIIIAAVAVLATVYFVFIKGKEKKVESPPPANGDDGKEIEEGDKTVVKDQ